MPRKVLVFVTVSFLLLTGCSFLSLESLPGTMDRLGNQRYGYHLLIPKKWHRSINSNIRPTELKYTDVKTEADIIIIATEGGKIPDMDEFVKSLESYKGAKSFTHIRSWRAPFDDNTGYIVNFLWNGKMRFGSEEYGKPGMEYQATAAVVQRNPTPIMLVCLSPKDKFAQLNIDYFGHARDSLKVEPVEITVREIAGE